MTERLVAIKTWVQELEVGRVEAEAGVEEKDVSMPLIKAVNIKRLLMGLKTCLFPRNHADGTVGLPTPVLMRIP